MQAIALNTKTDIEKMFTQNSVSLYRDINIGMMDIVLKRTDNKFIPSDKMTRGDAAVVLKRLFDKIW